MNQKHFSDLYQQTILTYGKNPKNFRKIQNACCSVEGQNRMCGDYLTVHLSFVTSHDGKRRVSDVSFEGEGCAILKASASMMTDLLPGKTIQEIDGLFSVFQKILHGELETCEELGQVNVFAGLGRFQSRIQCAVLPWDTLIRGIHHQCHTI